MMKLSDTLRGIARGTMMFRVHNPRTVSAEMLLEIADRLDKIEAPNPDIATETAAEEPPVDPEGCGMCEFRVAMVRALQEGQ